MKVNSISNNEVKKFVGEIELVETTINVYYDVYKPFII